MTVSVVVPCRQDSDALRTMESLSRQTKQPYEIVKVWDQGNGANWARNRGAKKACGDLLLFSDDDIEWDARALETLTRTLHRNPGAAYSYGSYEMGGKVFCDRAWDAALLWKTNYISTMSLVRASAFTDTGGFDESLHRLQDWDLWLSMLALGYYGAFCGKRIFTTAIRPGISFGGAVSWQEAEIIVKRKHGLC